jgi:hypothetical protein
MNRHKHPFQVQLTKPEIEVLAKVAEAAGDTIEEYLHSCIVNELEGDIDLYFGKSKAIKEKLYNKLAVQ